MLFNEDKQIKTSVPFLQDRTVLYVDCPTRASHRYIEENRYEIAGRFTYIGYTFLFLPELAGSLDPDVLHYMLPGQNDTLLAEDMYQHIRDMAGLDGRPGFLYKQNGQTYFRVIPESPGKEIDAAVDAFIYFLCEEVPPEAGSTCLSILAETDEPEIRFRFALTEDPLDPRTQAILDEWERLKERFGITIEDLHAMLGYTVKLSRLYITSSNRIFLADLDGRPEVRLDSLTKALYFFYLKHPEGAAFKELQSYENEILHIYMGITGRDDLAGIRRSVSSLVSPYSDGRNSSVSRIKKAFRDIVDDRIAQFYYIDGKYAEKRTVSLDRDLVIWEH